MSKRELIKKILPQSSATSQAVKRIIDAADAEGWLRDPDQTPDQTRTESEVRELWKTAYSEPGPADANFARLLGIAVVPDPEPTNAERLAEMLDRNVWRNIHTDQARSIAEYLDAHGVTAPGGETDE